MKPTRAVGPGYYISRLWRSRLAPAFSAYEEDDSGKIDSNGRKLRRIVYRWNGRFYARGR